MDMNRLRAPAFALVLLFPASASAGVLDPGSDHVWPGPDCAGTLQQCLDSAPSNHVVLIASDGPITTDIHLPARSMTLMAASGFAPEFGGENNPVHVWVRGGDSDVFVRLQGLVLRNGGVNVVQNGSATLDLTVADNRIQGLDLTADRSAVRIGGPGSSGSGPVTAMIVRNTVELTFEGGDDIAAFLVGDLHGATEVTVADNSITGGGGSALNTVQAYNAAGSLALDVIGNRIEVDGFHGGVGVLQSGAGPVSVRIINNLIAGTLQAGIDVVAWNGSTQAQVLNNTLVGNRRGILVQQWDGGSVTGMVGNNLVAFNSDTGIGLPASVFNSSNLVFGNASEAFTPEPSTVFADPDFVGLDDFRLHDHSPAVDAGDSGLLPFGVFEDLDGAPRVQGERVDIGAFEAVEAWVFASGFETT